MLLNSTHEKIKLSGLRWFHLVRLIIKLELVRDEYGVHGSLLTESKVFMRRTRINPSPGQIESSEIYIDKDYYNEC